MKKILGLTVLLCIVGCAPIQNGPKLESGPGYVRSVDTYHVAFIHETDQGYQKLFDICGRVVPVWQGEHANIHFHHMNDPNTSVGCEVIDSVDHLKGDLK